MPRILFFLMLKPVSMLPLPVLYLLADAAFFVLYRIVGFRKKIVLTNLRRSFPDRSDREIGALAKKFYRHLADVVIENIKTFSMSAEEAREHLRVSNPELLDGFFEQGRSVLLVIGHYNNWEWATILLPFYLKHRSVAVYTPLSNKFFDAKLKASRAQYGLELVAKEDTARFFATRKDQCYAVVLAADQSPTFSKQVHWTRFLHQDTAVMVGAERFGQRYNYPVVFGHVRKTGRGRYELRFEVVDEQPAASARGEITEKHTRILEEQIMRAPEYWLWTHRRWKRHRPQAL